MDETIIDIIARSDADFDGRPFDGLGRADRERYRDRARASLAALRAANVLVTHAIGFLQPTSDGVAGE